ncbi:TonB-dependent siderophore receptor, partial [Salmonella enterica subsp. enterica serovar Infantis]
TPNTHTNQLVTDNYGKETNRLSRQNYSLTWNGGWDHGVTTSNWVQYEHTRNARMPEGLAGGPEGSFDPKASQKYADAD